MRLGWMARTRPSGPPFTSSSSGGGRGAPGARRRRHGGRRDGPGQRHGAHEGEPCVCRRRGTACGGAHGGATQRKACGVRHGRVATSHGTQVCAQLGPDGSDLAPPLLRRSTCVTCCESKTHVRTWLTIDGTDAQLGWELGEEGNLLVAEPLFESKQARERLTQIMFEEFNVSGLFCAEQPVLSLYAVGKLTGCVVDVGHGTVDVAPVVEGQVYYPGVSRLPYGGQDIDQLLQRRLKERGIALSDAQLDALKRKAMECAEDEDAYEKVMIAAKDAEKSGKTCEMETHVLPDGQKIQLSREDAMTLGEACFQSSLFGLETGNSIVVAATTAVQAFPDNQVRRQLAESVVLCGGGAEAKGMRTRFQSEFSIMASAPGLSPSLVSPPEYMPTQTLEYAAWMGGAILARVVFQQNQHVTKFDYDESGPTVVHKKCT